MITSAQHQPEAGTVAVVVGREPGGRLPPGTSRDVRILVTGTAVSSDAYDGHSFRDAIEEN
jgi:hypothetical protein